MEQRDTHSQEYLKQRIDECKAEKGRLSRKVGVARRSGEDPGELIDQLKAVSDESKALQKQLKSLLNARPASEAEASKSLTDLSSPVLAGRGAATFEVLSDIRGPNIEAQWDAFVEKHPAGSPFHLIQIRDFIEKTCGHRTYYLCARDRQGAITGVLPLVQLKSRLFGNFIISVPYFNYGGILAYGSDTAASLLRAAEAWGRSRGVRYVELRHMCGSSLDLPRRSDKVIFWLPLPAEKETLWDGFRPKIRAQVRRAQREDPEVRIGGTELIDEFYDVFSRNMHRLGTPVYGKVFFRNLLEQLGSSAWLLVIRIKGRPAGCAFLVRFGNRMEIPWASTLQELNYTGVNMLMYWEALSLAISQGCKLFDFGRSTVGAGTYLFKQQWGAQPIPLHWEYWLADGEELPRLNPDNPKFKILIAVWQRLPLWITRVVGPGIVRSLP